MLILGRILVCAVAIAAAGITIGCSDKCQHAGDIKDDSDPAHPVMCLDRNKLGLIFDRFNRDDNASSLGQAETTQTWQVSAGTFGIIGNAAYSPAGVAGFATINAGGNQTLASVTMPVVSTGCGLVLRYSDSNNYFFLFNNSGTYFFSKIVGGVQTDLVIFSASGDPRPANGDALTVEMIADNFTPMVNNAEQGGLHGASDSALNTAIGYGFGCQTGSTTVRYDNFSVLQPNPNP